MSVQMSTYARYDNGNPGASSPTQRQRQSNSNSVGVGESLKKFYGKVNTLENANKIVLYISLAALNIDPLFLFIPEIDDVHHCFTYDKKLATSACVFRSFIDVFYFVHIIFYLKTEVIDPRRQVSSKGERKKSLRKKCLLWVRLIIDIVSILPIPQVVVVHAFTQQSDSLVAKKVLKWIILSQFAPRILRIYPHFREVTRASGSVIETKLIGAGFNLSMYMLYSYVVGAFWYVNAVEKKNMCWHKVCVQTPGCNPTNLYCVRGINNSEFLNTSCPLIDPDQITNSTIFNFGMYTEALRTGIADREPRDLPRKFFSCFWWGLRNISALGQNLQTCSSVGDTFFAIVICVAGLLLFAVLIGNVQKYLQSTTIREDQMEEERRATGKWMSYRKLPHVLKKKIRRYEDCKWRKTRREDEENLLSEFPEDLRLETKRHIYLDHFKRIPWLKRIDKGSVLEELCDKVKSVHYLENSYIVKIGAPVEGMIITTKGTTRTKLYGCYESFDLQAGDKDLLLWAFQHPDFSSLPASERIILTGSIVEGFILLPDALKSVVSHFKNLNISWEEIEGCFSSAQPHNHATAPLLSTDEA